MPKRSSGGASARSASSAARRSGRYSPAEVRPEFAEPKSGRNLGHLEISKEQPKERARDVHRFEVEVAAGKSAKQEVVEERDLVNQIAVTNLDDNTMRVIFNSTVTSKPVVEAVKKSQEMKCMMGETQRELAHARQQLTEIERDQTRIRANLKDTPATAAAYKKYLEKLDAQEGEIDNLTAKIKELQKAENQQRKGYENYLANLSVE